MSSTSQMVIDDSGGIMRDKISKKSTLLIGIAVLLVIIVVGVLAGVLSGNRERDRCDERINDARKEWSKGTTTKPPTSTEGHDQTTNPPTTKPPTSTDGHDQSTNPPTTAPDMSKPWNKIRLPGNILPVHYNMMISSDLDNFTFTGNSSIEINIIEDTKLIIFHINQINITQAEVVTAAQDSLAISREFEAKANQFYVIEMEKELEKGTLYHLKLQFSASMSTKELNGFYNSTYTDENGEKRVLGATDFQPTDARKAFPCFDEPAMKATFTMSIEHDTKYTALSNMPVVSVKSTGSRTLTSFQKSVRMSTYLVAYIVSQFKNLSTTTGTYNNITLSTWSTPGQYNDSKYGLSIGKNVTTFLEKYYDVPFPLPKQDMVAVPDFNSGAMENWGIITYRETALLYKKGVSSETNKQRIAYVVAHELAHMWFGNLVSCLWWNDIWLNEGFASYVEYLATDNAEPDWEFLDQFLVNDLHRAFALDALVSSHPITVDVEDPEQIKTLFDTITYSKGASIIRMLSHFLTEDVFRKGLTYYLNKHKFGSAETKDLWNALTEKAAGYDNVGTIMETWTDQMGFPVVNVSRNGGNRGKADQKQFLLDPRAIVNTTSPFDYKWYIPLTYVLEDEPNKEKQVWMNKSSVTFDWPDNKWIKCNYGQYGYYRVNYDKDNWMKLSNVLKTNPTTLTSSDRASLIDDSYNLARAGQLDYDIALTLSEYIKNEKRYVPWRTFMNSIGYLNTMLSTQDSYGLFKEYILNNLDTKIQSVGWTKSGNDKHLDIYTRSLILSAACSYGNKDANNNVTELFLNYLNQGTKLDVDLKTVIYYYGMSNTGYEEWNKLFEIYQNSTVASERSKLLYGLSGSKEPWVLQRFLRYSLDETTIRSQDTVTVVAYVAGNSIGREFAWKFVKENWQEFYDRYSKSSFRMSSVIKSTTQMMNTQIDLDDVTSFFTNRDTGSGARAADQAIERIQGNIEWVKRSSSTIAKYLEKNTK